MKKQHENMIFTNTQGCGKYRISLSGNCYAPRGKAHNGLPRDGKEYVPIRTGRPLPTHSSCKWFSFPKGNTL